MIDRNVQIIRPDDKYKFHIGLAVKTRFSVYYIDTASAIS